MPNQKIQSKLMKKKTNLYNFSDDSDEEFSICIQDDKMLPSSCENMLTKTDLSDRCTSENKFENIKKEETNSSVADTDSFVEVADVSIQTSLDNSVKLTDVVNTFEPIKEKKDSGISLDEVADVNLQFNLNCINNPDEIFCSNDSENGTGNLKGIQLNTIPIYKTDNENSCTQQSTSLIIDKNDNESKLKEKKKNLFNFSDDSDEELNFYIQDDKTLPSSYSRCENKLTKTDLSDTWTSDSRFNHIKNEEVNNSVTESDSFVEVADMSIQTSLDNSVKLTDVVNTKKDAGTSLDEVADIPLQFNLNGINNPDDIYSSDNSGNGTGGLKGIQLNNILAYDSDDEKACTDNSQQATSLIIEETDSENDEPVEDKMFNHTVSNHQKCKVRPNEINNIVGKMEEMSLKTRLKQDSSSSDDEFENFLNGVKQTMTAKAEKCEEKKKPSLQDFIVDDSDVDYFSDEDSDELFYIKVTHDLIKKEKTYSYDNESSPSSDDGLSSDSWNAEKKNPICTNLKHSDIDTLTSTGEFLKPQCTPRIPKKEMIKEKLENQTSIFRKETNLKDTHSRKDIDQDLLDENRHFLHSLSNDYPQVKRHPKAVRYWKCFKETKLELAQHLHLIFNEAIFENKLPEDLKIDWNPRYTKTAGTFSYKGRPNNFTAKVILSVKVCDSPERVRDTMAHELCHAAVKLINDVNEGHGPIWKSWAQKFNRKYPFMPVIVRCHDYAIKTKYTYQCTKCQYRIYRHSKSLDTDAKVCGHCRGKFEVFLTKDLESSRNRTATPRTPNKFAMFVKECYSAKKTETGLRHGDIMKLLSKEFAEKNSIHDQ